MHIAKRTERFTESVIREMTRLADMHNAINLAQGFPDFPCPDELKVAASAAINDDINQYAITWGASDFRSAIADKVRRSYGWRVDPERELTVTCGATEAMAAAMLATLDPGDEIIVFEPFYENYGADAILCGAIPKYVTLHEPDWTFDEDELRAAFGNRTRGIVLNSPHNPTGKVFTNDELEAIAGLCQRWGVTAYTDEIYEHIVFDGRHVPMATIDGMQDRTIAINALSKTYSVTGWRVGWVIAPPPLSDAVRKVHDFLTVGAPAPLQAAGVAAMNLPSGYYDGLSAEYRVRRDVIVPMLEEAGFGLHPPAGAYYVMTDISGLTTDDDVTFARRLVVEAGVAAVPGSSFYSSSPLGRSKLRFAFPKLRATLDAAGHRLRHGRGVQPATRSVGENQ